MAEVLIYERPVALNRTAHKDLRMQPVADVAFAAKVHSVPLTAAEFPAAARDFPILFAGQDLADAGPMALLGLRQFENLYVDEQGMWEEGAYIPAFVRRYPFVLAEKAPEAQGNDFTVFLDEAFSGFGTEKGERLFNEDGTDTEFLQNAVKFLGEFQEHVKATQAYTTKLRDKDLLEPRTVELKSGDKSTVLNGLFVVNEEKLRALDEKTMHEWMVDGTMGWTYAHLLSLANIERLHMRLNKRAPDTEIGEAGKDSSGSGKSEDSKSTEAKKPAEKKSEKAD